MEEILKKFRKDANSYQSIDPSMFDIDEFTEKWMYKHRNAIRLLTIK